MKQKKKHISDVFFSKVPNLCSIFLSAVQMTKNIAVLRHNEKKANIEDNLKRLTVFYCHTIYIVISCSPTAKLTKSSQACIIIFPNAQFSLSTLKHKAGAFSFTHSGDH